jgi:hypothetical protein
MDCVLTVCPGEASQLHDDVLLLDLEEEEKCCARCCVWKEKMEEEREAQSGRVL